MAPSELVRLLRVAEGKDIDGFVILERRAQHYMQCLSRPFGWVLEKREGDEAHHYRATTEPLERTSDRTFSIKDQVLRPSRPPMINITFEQVCLAMAAYLTGQPDSDWIVWRRLET